MIKSGNSMITLVTLRKYFNLWRQNQSQLASPHIAEKAEASSLEAAGGSETSAWATAGMAVGWKGRGRIG